MLNLKHISRKDLAEKIGCSPNIVSCYLRGKSEPKISTAYAMAQALGIGVDYLIEAMLLQRAEEYKKWARIEEMLARLRTHVQMKQARNKRHNLQSRGRRAAQKQAQEQERQED